MKMHLLLQTDTAPPITSPRLHHPRLQTSYTESPITESTITELYVRKPIIIEDSLTKDFDNWTTVEGHSEDWTLSPDEGFISSNSNKKGKLAPIIVFDLNKYFDEVPNKYEVSVNMRLPSSHTTFYKWGDLIKKE